MNSTLTFVYGALRSGTTVFGLMLNSHKEINNPGEVDFVFDYLIENIESDKWSYDVQSLRRNRIFQASNLDILNSDDGKLVALTFFAQLQQRAQGRLVLNIHRNLDKVAALVPDANVIHIIRDPRDVARSCIDMGWAGTTYFGIDQWLETENGWDCFAPRFKEHNNIMELFYEDLIDNPEEQLKSVCSFIGVPYSLAMLSYPNHSTYEAPDASAVEQWKTKLMAREVALVEIRAKALMLDRQYALSGYPLDCPSALERIRLSWKNKTYQWRFGCRRYGYFNFIMEKLTRKIGRPLHPMFLRRIDETTKRHLK